MYVCSTLSSIYFHVLYLSTSLMMVVGFHQVIEFSFSIYLNFLGFALNLQFAKLFCNLWQPFNMKPPFTVLVDKYSDTVH